MSMADELLNSIDELAINNEDHIVIGEDRFISVPKKLERLAVQYDHNIETVTFDCPRYWDEHDMSTMSVYINYLCPDGSSSFYRANNVRVDDSNSNIMHFDWTISRNVTNTPGKLMFIVCVKNSDNDSNEINHWNSELCTDCYISKGLEVYDEEFVDIAQDMIEQWQRQVTKVTNEILEAKANGDFKGERGEPGISPTVTVTEINRGHRLTINDVNGEQSFDVLGTIVDGTEAVNELLNQFVYKGKMFYATSVTTGIGSGPDFSVYSIEDADFTPTNGATYTVCFDATNDKPITIIIAPNGYGYAVEPRISGSNSTVSAKNWIVKDYPMHITYSELKNRWIADVDIMDATKLVNVVQPTNGGTGKTKLSEIWEPASLYSYIYSDTEEVNDPQGSLNRYISPGKYTINYQQFKENHAFTPEQMTNHFPFKKSWDICTLVVENLHGDGRLNSPPGSEKLHLRQTLTSSNGEIFTRCITYNGSENPSNDPIWEEQYTSSSSIQATQIAGLSQQGIRYGTTPPADAVSRDGDIFAWIIERPGQDIRVELHIWLRDYNGWHPISME